MKHFVLISRMLNYKDTFENFLQKNKSKMKNETIKQFMRHLRDCDLKKKS